ncbi:synaptotagmin-like protein 2 isoform X2 [Plectropomus leopardus]|uniref:synaptotagmin-like protein 2 isoform X2 n=1 Tax=Plectropomus leopardus TaxID=160734 RepID=UPI001C4BD87B|nr:synaptotagmin-like protein 2 isoform X2 [Plectropomus leopardus]
MDPAGGCSILACFNTCPLRGGTMIDLSHLTEEEQGMIMTVLRRDAELKKAEEERIRRLEKLLDNGSQSDAELKYLTGEWFYEAKSRRHMDKIHGSEIILASMKQRKAGLDGSLRMERSKTPSSQGSDGVPPPKPARCFEGLQPQKINDAEKENLNSTVRSPRTPRHNPFNRASLIVVEPPENVDDTPISRDQESSVTEPISPLKIQPAEASQTSGGSVTSEGSSVGFRPVPKKRTFLSRQTSCQLESTHLVLDTQGGSVGIVPAPRRSLQRGSSESSNQSCLKGQDEMSQKSDVSYQVSQSAQPSKPLDEISQQPLCDVSQVSSNSSVERERNLASITRDRPATYTRSDASTDREIPQKNNARDDWTQREYEASNTVVLQTGSIQDSDGGNNSSVGGATRQEELSLPQSTVDPEPPVSYDLNFIDMSDQQVPKKSSQKHAFQLSTQSTSPTGDEDSIAKVLDWFNRSTDSLEDDGPKVTKSSVKHTEISRGEDSLRQDVGDIISDRKNETLEMRRNPLQRQTTEALESRATDRTGNREVIETQEDGSKDNRERMRPAEVKDNTDESQPPQISHLMSFWEKSNPGPKILISKSNTPGDKGRKPVHLSAEKDEKRVNKPYKAPDMPSVPGIYNEKGIYYTDQKNNGDDAQLNNNQEVDSLVMNTYDPKYNSDYLKSAARQIADRRESDTEILCVSPQPKTPINLPQPDSISQSRETTLQDELSRIVPVSQLEMDLDSDKFCSSKNTPYMDYKKGNIQVTSRAQISSEDVKTRDSEDKNVQSSMSPKRKEDKDRLNSPRSNRQSISHQESTAEKIKQLKSFWEQEGNKPTFYTGKPKALGDGRVARGSNQAKLNKRYTKSEFDLTSVGNDYDSDEDPSARNHPNFTVLPLNQRIEKSSPNLGTSRAQFNTLREFWGDATSDNKGPFPFDKPKSPKRKEPIKSQLSSQELKCGDPEISETTRPALMRSSPPLPNRSKLPHDRQPGSRAMNGGKNNLSHYTTAESKRSSKDSNKEEKSTKVVSSPGREIRSPKSRKDSFSNSSSRGSSMRRATSMFALSVPDNEELIIDVSPVHSHSRKQRQNAEKGASPKRSQEDTETLTPRARACVPRDYRHYLGMTDDSSVHTSLAPAVKDEGPERKSGYEFDVSMPMRTSTPVSSEERYTRRGGKTSQRPLWTNYSSSDAGQESSVSSTSDTRPTSRNSSTREYDHEDLDLVRKALRRAEARPKSLAKSVEDITASLSPRQERRQDPTDESRRISDVSSIPSYSSSLYSDLEQLKKMSKSVPSFLQEEDLGRDSDSIYEDSDLHGRLTMSSSLSNLTSSSGMATSSSLSGSVMTMYSGDFGNVDVQGNIQFSINYIHKLREFHIFVAELHDLAAVDPKRGRSDPYVKSYLVPDKANLGKRKTSVKKKTLNPTFNEILRYRVRMEYLRTQTLILSVWHHDTFGRNSFLGEVDVDLSKWDFDHTQMNYLALKARTAPTLEPSHGRGEMRLALRFLPQIIHSEGTIKGLPNTGEVHIWVKECKNLPLIRAAIDPYVKCFVLPDTSRRSRQKTRVLRRTVDPAFNHTMVYDGIREADLLEACVELTVWDRDRLASNLLGGLRLGAGTGKSYGAPVDWMDSTPYEAALWERMMTTPNEWVEDVLPLRVLSSAKTTFK